MCGQQAGNPRFPNPVPDVRPRPQRPAAEPVKGEKGDKGDRGEKGEKGDPGDPATAEQVAAAVVAILERYPDRFRGPKGDKGDPGEPADVSNLVTKEELQAAIAGIEFPPRRVVLADGSSRTIIDDEIYNADEAIVIDVQAITNAVNTASP